MVAVLPSAATTVLEWAAVIVAIGAASGVLFKLWKSLLTKIEQVAISAAEHAGSELRKELKPNGGSSFRDEVVAEIRLTRHDVKQLDKKVERMDKESTERWERNVADRAATHVYLEHMNERLKELES